MTEHTIGIDISKTHLDVFRLEDQAAQRFENAFPLSPFGQDAC